MTSNFGFNFGASDLININENVHGKKVYITVKSPDDNRNKI
jgi:hypothetical protein